MYTDNSFHKFTSTISQGKPTATLTTAMNIMRIYPKVGSFMEIIMKKIILEVEKTLAQGKKNKKIIGKA